MCFRFASFLVVLMAVACKASPQPPIALVDGRTLDKLEFVTQPAQPLDAVCHYTTDGVLACDGKPIGYIATKASFTNYRLHVEWRWPKEGANGGVLLHIATGPKDRAWPECFQVQLKTKRAGDLLPMAGARFAEALSTPPDAKTPQLNHRQDNVEKPIGEWNSCDVTCHDGTIEVSINGVPENKVTDATPGAGKIGIQFEGRPFELRNVSVTPLD